MDFMHNKPEIGDKFLYAGHVATLIDWKGHLEPIYVAKYGKIYAEPILSWEGNPKGSLVRSDYWDEVKPLPKSEPAKEKSLGGISESTRDDARTTQDRIVAHAERIGLSDSDKIGEYADSNGHLLTVGDLRKYIYPQWLGEFQQMAADYPDQKSEPAKELWMMTRTEIASNAYESLGIRQQMDVVKKASGVKKDRANAYLQTLRDEQEKAVAEHEASVKKALASGKPVPQGVLKDYPELAKKEKWLEDKSDAKSPSGYGLQDAWDAVIDHPEDYSGREGVVSIIEKSGLTRATKDMLTARLDANLEKKANKGMSLSELQSIESSRSPLSQSSDERQSNADTIDDDDPRVEVWKRDPGRLDVKGVDTPKRKKTTRKKHSRPPTSLGGLK